MVRAAFGATCVVVLALSMRSVDSRRSMVEMGALEAETGQSKGCSATTCISFESGAECSCDAYVGSPELLNRAKAVIYTMSQSMRYLSDYHASASSWQKMWSFRKNMNIFGGSLEDVEFLTGAMTHLEELSAIVSVPAGEVPAGALPAGAMPIMVEIWDKDITTNEFVGEVGVPLIVGRHSYNKTLRSNPSRSMKTHEMALEGKSLGSVAFDVSLIVERQHPPTACAADASKPCADLLVTVTCKSASGLANVDTFSETDPYCKVRMKQDADHPSTKDATPYINDHLHPTWTESNSFTHRWEVELVPALLEEDQDEDELPLDSFVPLTLDRMAVWDQFVSNLNFYIKAKALGGKECKDVEEKSTSQEKLCSILERVDEDGVDDALVDELAADAEDQGLKDGLQQIKDQLNDGTGSESLAEVSQDEFFPGRAGAIHAASRRRGRGRFGGHRHGGGHLWGPHAGRPVHYGGGFAVVLVVLIILLLPIGL